MAEILQKLVLNTNQLTNLFAILKFFVMADDLQLCFFIIMSQCLSKTAVGNRCTMYQVYS